MSQRPHRWHTNKREPRTREYWRNRTRTLKANPECTIKLDGICTGKATQADHIVRVADGGSDDLTNLRAACAECNKELNYQTRQTPKQPQRDRGTEQNPWIT